MLFHLLVSRMLEEVDLIETGKSKAKEISITKNEYDMLILYGGPNYGLKTYLPKDYWGKLTFQGMPVKINC